MAQHIRKVQLLKHPNGKSPNWYLRWWESVDGPGNKSKWQERWRSTRTSLKRKAEQLLRQLERELEADPEQITEWTWNDLVEEYLVKHKGRLAPKTLEIYRLSFEEFARSMRVTSLSQIKLSILEDFIQVRFGHGVSPATVNRDLRHLRVLLKWARRRGVLSEVPDFFGLLVKEDRRDPTVMPEEDFVALLSVLREPSLQLKKRPPEWWRIFLYLTYYLGVRRGEALGICWGDISYAGHEVRIQAGTSKSRKDRIVPISPELTEILKQWHTEHPHATVKDPVLSWPYESLRAIYVDWHLIQTAAGIPEGQHYVPQDCRSSCASELTARDVPTVVVRDFLGHASVTTTERYYINTKPAMRAAANVRKIAAETPEETPGTASSK